METKLRKDAITIFRAALKAADPVEAVGRFLTRRGDLLIAGRKHYKLSAFDRIWVIGAGKASAAMALGVEKALGKRINGGVVVVKYGHGAPLKRVEVHEAGHPVPDEAGVAGATRLAEIARNAGARDLVICLISGGASALTPSPLPPLTLAGKQQITRRLLDSGANIHEINTVRKHLSAIKGGQLARLASPATLITLMLSDVIGDSMQVIGSGPTVPDTSTLADARAVLKRYGLEEQAAQFLQAETPGPEDPAFAKTHNIIAGSNRLAVDAAAAKAKQLGYKPLVLSTFIEGETRDVARMHAAIAREIHSSGRPAKRPVCVISGGETTVTIRGKGLGGRNQEFTLAAAMDAAGLLNTVILSAGTDGTDGPTDAAGAIADGRTVARAVAAGLNPQDFLDRNDSYHFFQPLNDLLITGPTRTNVMDVHLILVS
jgi:hydroxypyruvate reductase